MGEGVSHMTTDSEGRPQTLQGGGVDARKRGEGNEEQFWDSWETKPGFTAHCDNMTADFTW